MSHTIQGCRMSRKVGSWNCSGGQICFGGAAKTCAMRRLWNLRVAISQAAQVVLCCVFAGVNGNLGDASTIHVSLTGRSKHYWVGISSPKTKGVNASGELGAHGSDYAVVQSV